MANVNELIIKSSVASDFNTFVLNKISYTWDKNRPPRPGDHGCDEGSFDGEFGVSDWGFSANNISGTTITASTLLNAIRNVINNNCSRVANVRAIWRYYGDTTAVIHDQTSRAVLRPDYCQSISSTDVDISAGNIMRTDSYNSFLSSLYTAWDSAASRVALTITFYKHQNYTQHSSRLRR